VSSGPHRIERDTIIECGTLVIGSGAGGATVAARLAEAGHDVVIVEEGPYVDHAGVPDQVPEGMSRLWRGGGLTVALGRTPIAYAEGRCVGGGTEINSAIMQRAPETLLEDWARTYQITDYGPTQLRSYYDRSAAIVNASLTPPPLGAASDILQDAGARLGWKISPLERAQRYCVGTNLCSIGCPTGGKQSMTATQIPAALARGARLIAECNVRRLVLKGSRVTRVDAIARAWDGLRHRVRFRPRDVFVCAGAVHTPALLRRNGVRRNVGNTLRLHPTLKVVARFAREINAQRSRLPLNAITEFMPDQRLGGSVFLPGYFGMSVAEDWENRRWLLEEWRNCGMYYAMARGSGTGTVRSVPGLAEPLVSYALSPVDWNNLGLGVARLGQAMFAAGATHVYPSIVGHPGWTSAETCTEFADRPLPASRTNLMTIHLFSSCPPGEDLSRCATNSFGRVHGTENLFLADASQVPEAPGVNPQLTIMAMALRNAEAFLAGVH
jgi:choline dehydrogenase-like flavoprotein